MTPDEAEHSVAQLEAALAYHLTSIPVGTRDQWTTHVRTLLDDMRVETGDQAQMLAAFAGAYMMANLLMPVSRVPLMQAGAAVGMLRDLLNRSRDEPVGGDLEALLADPEPGWEWGR